jgi:hypothetical protein
MEKKAEKLSWKKGRSSQKTTVVPKRNQYK